MNMAVSNVADLTIDEFRRLIKEVVTQPILELLGDPDEGLELQEDIEERLQRSLIDAQASGETRPAQDVAARLGLEW
jgi:hypothetical protein